VKEIPIGAKGSFTLEVKAEHLASRFKDTVLPHILATPVMIMVMENAALNAIKAYLEPGESAVGIRVNIRHLAATPAGMRVVGEAEVTRVDGRRLEFTVRATDEIEEIGNGTHERMIVDVARLSKRLDAKRATLSLPKTISGRIEDAGHQALGIATTQPNRPTRPGRPGGVSRGVTRSPSASASRSLPTLFPRSSPSSGRAMVQAAVAALAD
jgi:fluoroacetyl-CoA thioesterase